MDDDDYGPRKSAWEVRRDNAARLGGGGIGAGTEDKAGVAGVHAVQLTEEGELWYGRGTADNKVDAGLEIVCTSSSGSLADSPEVSLVVFR